MTAAIDQDRWMQATIALTEVNDILRTSWLQVTNNEWVGVVLRSPQLDPFKANCRDETEAADIIEAIWRRKFVFGEPFITYAMLSYPDGFWDLVIKMNHAAYDGTLLRIFDDHFGAILRARPVPRHTTFYDFAFHIFSRDKSASLAYWQAKLSGSPRVAALTRAPWASATAPVTTASFMHPLSTRGIDRAGARLGVTPSSLFHGAFQAWLARATGCAGACFDYLLTGRNVGLAEPQSINGTAANFLPVRTEVDAGESLAGFLGRCQEDFWAVTDHGDVGLDEIYCAAGLTREAYGNRALFIFQPFEPSAKDDPALDFRWLVMAKSKVRMPMPYALAVEVFKAAGKAHNLKVSYDEGIISAEQAKEIAAEIGGVVHALANFDGDGLDRTVGEVLNL